MTAMAGMPVALLVSSLGTGGAERHTIALANHLADRFAIDLIYLKRNESLLAEVGADRLAGVHCLEARSRLDLAAVGRLRDLLERRRTQVVLCTNMYPLAYAQAAALGSRRPPRVVEVFHTTIVSTLRDRIQMAMYRPLLEFGVELVYISEGQRNYWQRRGLRARCTHLVQNGVDVTRFVAEPHREAAATIRSRYGFSPDDMVVGICAVLRPEKAHDHLVAAVDRLRAEGCRWKILIIGDGPCREAIARDVADRGLDGDVAFTGMIPDVRPAVVACDAMALVSTSIETFSIAALESMALERPMVISDIGGARELVRDGENGIVFSAGDIDALVRALRRLHDRRTCEAMGREASARVRRLFSEDLMIRRYEDIIRGAATR